VSSRDELGQTNQFSYDPLNRIQQQVLPDLATNTFGYNAMGGLTSRAMPGGLTWSAIYDPANRISSEQLTGNLGSTMTNRTFSYQYYASNTPTAGRSAGRRAGFTLPYGPQTKAGHPVLAPANLGVSLPFGKVSCQPG